jgi:hypothetical protein
MSEWETEGDVVDFLRREAPIELERLESIARLVASERDPDPGWLMPLDSSYVAWLPATFGIVPPRIGSEAVRDWQASVAG